MKFLHPYVRFAFFIIFFIEGCWLISRLLSPQKEQAANVVVERDTIKKIDIDTTVNHSAIEIREKETDEIITKETISTGTGEVAIIANSSGLEGELIRFKAENTKGALCTWDFGDFTQFIKSSRPVNHVFYSSGDYTVWLTVNGKKIKHRITIKQKIDEPRNNKEIKITGPEWGYAGEQISFTAENIKKGVSCSWSFDGMTDSYNNSPLANHVFSTPCVHTVKLTVNGNIVATYKTTIIERISKDRMNDNTFKEKFIQAVKTDPELCNYREIHQKLKDFTIKVRYPKGRLGLVIGEKQYIDFYKSVKNKVNDIKYMELKWDSNNKITAIKVSWK